MAQPGVGWEHSVLSYLGASAVFTGAWPVTVVSPSVRACVRSTMTPSEVHTLGRAEVARIEARYQRDVLDALGFKGSFAEFVAERHRPDSGHYFAEADQLLGA